MSTSPGFAPDFAGADLVVVPNGSSEYGGALLVPTPDPVVGHGIQQVRRPDHSCDNLTAWPCGVRPAGRFEVDPAAYGRPWADPRAADPRAADPRAAGAPAA